MKKKIIVIKRCWKCKHSMINYVNIAVCKKKLNIDGFYASLIIGGEIPKWCPLPDFKKEK